MITMQQVRSQYPQYHDLSDMQLADALHQKHYSDMPREDFYSKIGLQQQPKEESKGWSGIASDIFNKGAETLSSIPDAVSALPEEIQGGWSQLFNNPKRVAQSIGTGFGELGHGVLSAPANVRDYLAKKDIVSQEAPSFRLPESILPKEFNYAEALGRKGKEPGDVLWEAIPSVAASGELPLKLPGYAQKLTKAVTSKIPPVSSKGIASKIVADKAAVKKTYNQLYGNLFEEANKQGITTVKPPKGEYSFIEKNSLPKYHKGLTEYLNNPIVDNAHKAQSDLGKLRRALDKSNAIAPLTSTQNKVFREAGTLQDKIKSEMFKKTPELGKKYDKITAGYAKDVIPYTGNKAINQFEKGELYPKKLVSRLKNNDKFMIELGKKYPGMKVNQLLKSPLSKKGLHGAILGAFGAEGVKLYRDLTH